MALPDPHHVLEKTEGHRRVDRALVLEEHVDQDLSLGRSDREEQIRVATPEELVHEGARAEGERGEIDALGDGLREHHLEEARGVLDLRERSLDEKVV